MARNLKKKKRVPKTRKASNKGEGTSKTTQQDAKVWQPGVDKLEEGEELQCDTSAYDCLHAFHIGWPCLSFDIIHDSLGVVRTEFPHTVFCIAGTQADNAANNAVGVVKLSNISGKKRKLLPAGSDDDEDDSDNSSDEDDEDDDDLGFESKKPTLQVRMVAHQGCINRIRSMQQQPSIVATWADNGYMQIWDFNTHLSSLATSDPRVSTALSAAVHQAPLQIFSGHKDEGYALDWSPVTPARLLSGDCKGCIHLWEPTSGGKWTVDKSPFKGHTDSVEDLQWSPTEANVFASCSVDRKIAIWDARIRTKVALVRDRGKAQSTQTVLRAFVWQIEKMSSMALSVSCTSSLLSSKTLSSHSTREIAPQSSLSWSSSLPSLQLSINKSHCNFDRQALIVVQAAWTRRSKSEADKNPRKKSWKQRTDMYMRPFLLDVFISKKYIHAKVMHRVTSKVVSVATTNARDLRNTLPSLTDLDACRTIGKLIAERSKEADVYAMSYEPRKGERVEGKLGVILDTIKENDIAFV